MRLALALIGVISLSGCGLDESQPRHAHEGPHGAPRRAASVEAEMRNQVFVDDEGEEVRVDNAKCVGDGPPQGRYTHLMCELTFETGLVDKEVFVHVLPEPDRLMFQSMFAFAE